MTIRYAIDTQILTNPDGPTLALCASQFQQLLKRCSLGARRPSDDLPRLEAMLKNSNVIVSAWHDDELVGIARSVTDFSYCCYLSDLAVDDHFQRQGIGKQLIQETQQAIGNECKLIVISAPAANDYYPALGFEHNDRCWVKS